MVALAALLTIVFGAVPAHATPAPASSAPASGAPEQWAFGGHASVSLSCSDSNCGGNGSFTGSESLQYYVEWVVIYTLTNTSSGVMIEGQAAINASASLAITETLNGETVSASASLSGLESAVGFTNVTVGAVALTSASNLTTWNSPALAIQNASSSEAFNFSGQYSEQTPNGSLKLNFDFGGHESSAVSFSPGLGIVPLDPQPGDSWTASAPFQASGSWISGYSLSLSGGSYGNGYTNSSWRTGTVAANGVLAVNGSDLGAVTLYDNYTTPPTTVNAQLILLDFGSGNFTGADGWILVPSDFYAGASSGLSGAYVADLAQGASPASSGLPAASSTSSSESVDYQQGAGFIGGGLSGSTSLTVGPTGSSPVSAQVNAGPEPVAVAQQQYSAMTSGSGSSSGLGAVGLVIGVVVVLAVVVVAVMLLRRSRARRRPPVAMRPYAAPGAPVGSAPPSAGEPPPPSN